MHAEGANWCACCFLQVEPNPLAERPEACSLAGAGGGFLSPSPFPFSLVRSPSTSQPTECVRGEAVPDSGTAARFLSSLGLNKGKQITKMEIFKLAFRGIQIDVWVARRHRPHSCYFVIKMIPKIPPCFGFRLLKRLVSFPRRISPSSGERQPPDHAAIANSGVCAC